MIHRVHERRSGFVVESYAGEPGKRGPQLRCHLTDLDETHHVGQEPSHPRVLGIDDYFEAFALQAPSSDTDQKSTKLVEDPRIERTIRHLRRRRIARLEVCWCVDRTYGNQGLRGAISSSGRASRNHEQDHGSNESHRDHPTTSPVNRA